MKEAHSTVLFDCWMVRRKMVRMGSVKGTLIPTLVAMVVLVDRTGVEKALVALRLTVFT